MLDESTIEFIAGPQLPAHVYVHVPFCRSKCSYCDFTSLPEADDELVGAVAAAIRSDLRRWGEGSLPGVVETLYLGGGTPTFVPEHTLKILERARSSLALREGAEITVEANPDSLSYELAAQLKDAGVTRLSLGVQSFDDRVLRVLGRAHDAQSAVDAARAAATAGLNLSIDLMCGVPGQSMTSWQETLDHALRTEAQHVSVYPLSIEEGTPLFVACDAGLVQEQDSDVVADMMILAEDVLSAAGLNRYEVANYARPGFESRHNSAYWTGRSYLGIGPSAHGMFDEATARSIGLLDAARANVAETDAGAGMRVRVREVSDIGAWLFGAQEEVELLTAEEALREDVMLGMRLVAGVSVDRVVGAGLEEVFRELESRGLVELASSSAEPSSRRWRTTRRGWLLGNEVFGRIWAAE